MNRQDSPERASGKSRRAVVLASCVAMGAACSAVVDDDHRIGTLVHEDFPGGRSGEATSSLSAAGARIVCATRDGRWAVASADTGLVETSTEPRALGLVDAALDRAGGGLLAFEAYPDDEGGELVRYPLPVGDAAGAGWAPREVLARTSGDARVWPTPLGPVVFEVADGSRWRLLSDAHGFTPSLPLGPPASVWATGADGAGAVSALLHGVPGYAPQLLRLDVPLAEEGLGEPLIHDLGIAPSSPVSARAVPAEWLDALVIAQATPEGISLELVSSCSPPHGETGCAPDSSGLLVPLVSERVEEVLVLEPLEVVALLLSSPARVVAVRLPAAGAASLDAYELLGPVRRSARFFSRDLAGVGPRLFAATTEGVVALDVEVTADGVALAATPGFSGAHLAGPLQVYLPPPAEP